MSETRFGHIVLSIYIHYEYYPPTLYAISSLASMAESITVVTRNLSKSKWEFPSNVEVKVSGEEMSLDMSMRRSTFGKVKSFIQYLSLLRNSINGSKPEIVVLHDPIALFAHWLLSLVRRTPYIIWYHNHDVIEPGSMRKYSVTWFAENFQKLAFQNIDVFSLPTPDRKKYFPPLKTSASYHTVHNYPSKVFYEGAYQKKNQPTEQLKLLYQGVIGPGHGLEEVIAILNRNILSCELNLTILGMIDSAYKSELRNLAIEKGVDGQLEFIDRIPYKDLPQETRKHDIGLAIHCADSIQYSTGGLASNKIYEYAALGLPVLYYDNEQYNDILSDKIWANSVNLAPENIRESLTAVVQNYSEMSHAAHSDFMKVNNYEHKFLDLVEGILK